MVTDAQIRAARALLGMEQAELAGLSEVSLRTVKRVEVGTQVRAGTIEALQRALERRGIEFIEENGGGPGVRLKKRRR